VHVCTATDVVYIALASVPDRLTRLAVGAAALGLLGWSVATAATRSTGQSVLAAIAAFLIADLGKYLVHRASHTVPWLWRFHLAHHQPTRLSALNALRLHPVNMAYNAAIDTVPLLLFGVSPRAAAVLAALRATVGVVQHANLDLEVGRQWLVNAPSYHRVHHHVDAAEANHNFASTLLVWDYLFGTLRRAPAPPLVGVEPTRHRLPVGYVGQLVYPWCGDRLDTTCLLARFPWMVR
jgi:ornithine lipid hydroxylase